MDFENHTEIQRKKHIYVLDRGDDVSRWKMTKFEKKR